MNVYTRYYKNLVRGSRSAPRGQPITYKNDQVYNFMPGTIVRRKGDNPAIGLTELVQLIAGEFDHEGFAACAPNSRLDLFTEQMAYGPRARGQFEEVIQELTLDPDSRRAVVMITKPFDSPGDRPCTLSMQFQLRRLGGRIESIHGTFCMRSSDAIWGLPNDLIQFGGVVMALGSVLGTGVTSGSVMIGNAHVYDSTKPVDVKFDESWTFDMPALDSWPEYVVWARGIMHLRPNREELFKVFRVRSS